MAMYNPQLMAAALRNQPAQKVQYAQPDVPVGGGMVARPTDQYFTGNRQMTPGVQPQQPQQGPNLLQMQQNGQMANKGMDMAKTFFGGGATSGAQIGDAASYYGPEVAKMGGSVTAPASAGGPATGSGWMSSLGNMFSGGGGGAGASAGSGAAGMAGTAGAVIGAGLLADNQMNEKDGMFNADKMNSWGSRNGIGIRAGDFVNGINPATWASDPKKAAKGLGNAFTFGLMDKII